MADAYGVTRKGILISLIIGGLTACILAPIFWKALVAALEHFVSTDP